MNEEKFTQEEIRAYLLGSLTEAEAENFDELSVTNDDFAELLKSAENDLVDEYVRGELTGETLEKFESYYQASPLRREKIEFAESLNIFTGRNFTGINEKPTSNQKTSSGFFASFLSFINSKPLQTVFAAAVLLLILSGLWFVNKRNIVLENEVAVQNTPASQSNESPQQSADNLNQREIAAAVDENDPPQNTANNAVNMPANKNVSNQKSSNSQTQKTPVTPPKTVVAAFFLAPGLRGNNQLKTFSVAKETTDIAVTLQLESDDYPDYRVALTDESGETNIWQSSALKARGTGENKQLNFRFPAKLLKSQIYSFSLSGIKAGKAEIITNYTFRAVLK